MSRYFAGVETPDIVRAGVAAVAVGSQDRAAVESLSELARAVSVATRLPDHEDRSREQIGKSSLDIPADETARWL